MTTIADAFRRRSEGGRAALVPYVTAGYPRVGDTVAVLHALSDAGADVIELGIPFSDPLADGPTIQRSSFRALEGGVTTESVLADLRAFRAEDDTPVVLFTYLNPVLRYGVARFLEDARGAGAQGLLLTDLPAGADPELEDQVRASGLDLVRLVAPTTPPERIPDVAASGSGFLYYISRTGVTGARTSLREDLADEVRSVRDAVSLPVAVGFGISTPEQAAAVGGVADGVVVGSAIIQALDEGGVEGARAFVASLRQAMDRA
ncbi:MAG: tryptophan synthase subunit alpha [Gemmatimonadota bacterium]|nr:tryptophan synthase subunit alpha [Gemmatimonadota bacterium]MDH5761054.1 tryptophan synthase subunit alpha [Gemmatimonadota bacterium]